MLFLSVFYTLGQRIPRAYRVYVPYNVSLTVLPRDCLHAIVSL